MALLHIIVLCSMLAQVSCLTCAQETNPGKTPLLAACCAAVRAGMAGKGEVYQEMTALPLKCHFLFKSL